MIQYRFKLLPSERLELLAKVQKGKAAAKPIQKAQVLLDSDDTLERQSETLIAATYPLSTRSVEHIRKDTFGSRRWPFLPLLNASPATV